MDEPHWINTQKVLIIHEAILSKTGGSDGLRDPGLLESALNRPTNAFNYSAFEDIFDLAALYLHGISRNHAFIDGNKRTAFVVADVFLRTNGYYILPEKRNEQFLIVEGVATGNFPVEQLADFLRKNSTKIESASHHPRAKAKTTDVPIRLNPGRLP